MRNHGAWMFAAAAAIGLLFTASAPVDAKPAYSKDEKRPCSFCHVGKAGDKVFTEAGTFYGKHHTLKGFAEGGKAPEAPVKAAPAPVSAPAASAPAPVSAATAEAPAAGDAARMGKPVADSGDPCRCGCPHCKEKGCTECGRMHGKGEMPPMMEKMKGHLEEMKKAVASLRDSEKAVEGAADVETLRNAVLAHLKKIDDLQESHLRHMESMMDARHGGKMVHPHRPCE